MLLLLLLMVVVAASGMREASCCIHQRPSLMMVVTLLSAYQRHHNYTLAVQRRRRRRRRSRNRTNFTPLLMRAATVYTKDFIAIIFAVNLNTVCQHSGPEWFSAFYLLQWFLNVMWVPRNSQWESTFTKRSMRMGMGKHHVMGVASNVNVPSKSLQPRQLCCYNILAAGGTCIGLL